LFRFWWYNISNSGEKTPLLEISMIFLDFKNALQDYLIFNQKQIKAVFPGFDQHRLKEWQKKKYIEKLCKGFYFFSDLEITDITKYHFANQIYTPSYISLDLVLANHGLIPETVFATSSVTTLKKRNIFTDHGNFLYRTIKKELFFGYQVERLNQIQYKIADLEKAVLDYFYLNNHLNTPSLIQEIRFDCELFFELINEEKFYSYLSKFKNKSLEKRIQILKEYQ
jgi:predicted transcriptional regulator of viral defense system